MFYPLLATDYRCTVELDAAICVRNGIETNANQIGVAIPVNLAINSIWIFLKIFNMQPFIATIAMYLPIVLWVVISSRSRQVPIIQQCHVYRVIIVIVRELTAYKPSQGGKPLVLKIISERFDLC
ncbi:hypothetical protein BT96DRAFT_925291 [Gymnopus androsaceus JB14]|uniref:Uncharacterized protein n=1 Tax=Gymnopus androsaceus JB14 TaxID=1447944 RepID=A0A6A4H1D1_9AGAR|nr:hypothetical protein BT96DRAFT_925291 [Gymnopus androsaceus JB14]